MAEARALSLTPPLLALLLLLFAAATLCRAVPSSLRLAPRRIAPMALSSSWDGSNVHEDHVEFLRQTRRLPGESFVRVR